MPKSQLMPATQILAALNWRYAVKVFDPNRIIPETDWQILEKSLVLSPSSYGLQPWRFLVVENKELRTKLLGASMHQVKVVDSSHLVVFTARTDIDEAYVTRWIARIAEVRHVPSAALAPLQGMMTGDLVTGRRHAIAGEWAKRQVFLALGEFLTTAAMLGIDACPMEGFDPVAYDEILGLGGLGFTTTVIASVGYRSAQDPSATEPKIRFPIEDLVKHLK